MNQRMKKKQLKKVNVSLKDAYDHPREAGVTAASIIVAAYHVSSGATADKLEEIVKHIYKELK